ncbi:Lipid A export ATP-binding/permease protein MsbA [Paenibacillus konkukensis]|uniref:Lipid A export ATP-binding/permease protein MsbA n=1 Tax=Paenibacillus konkukensis TaxID=2020716 RepID=A0ABY4RXQ1_9BACL|nr:ABC transporter ATP-binding protein [Paenibacillus konkukensis]UQZ87459.1 Lipid A export ATP-binding/permease protein MsbA [Paenibacillus konkukensis]
MTCIVSLFFSRLRAVSAFLRHADAGAVRIKPVADAVQLLLMPVQLLLTKAMVDRLPNWSSPSGKHELAAAAVLLATVMIVQAFVGRASLLSHSRLSEIGAYEVEHAVLAKSAKLPLALLESSHVKDLRLRAMRASPDNLFMQSNQYILQIIQVIILLLILLFYGHWPIVLLYCIVLPVQLKLRSYAARVTEQLGQEQIPQRRAAMYLAQLLTDRRPAQEIRLLGTGDRFRSDWLRLHAEFARRMINRTSKEQLTLAPSELLVTLAVGLSAALVLAASLREGRSAGDVTLLLQATVMLGGLWPGLLNLQAGLKTLGMRWDDLQQYRELQEDKVFGLEVSAAAEGSDRSRERNGEHEVRSLRAERLCFTYPQQEEPALDAVTFQVEAGEKIAVVGENGSGKTTLIKLLLGLYEADSGGVIWTDASGERRSASEARHSFTAVLQDFSKMHLLVREHVGLGRVERLHDDEALLEALRQAGAGNWGLELDERTGPEFGGRELSGGQWQALAAARAYFRGGSVLFFDEPTSALDPLAEKKAMEVFMVAAGQRTAFLVTHRMGAARMADRIFVMKQGRLVEQGTHEELLRLRGEYERLYRLQASWYV